MTPWSGGPQTRAERVTSPSYQRLLSELPAIVFPTASWRLQPVELIDRGLTDIVVEAMQESRVVALLGARQAGKSTVARMLASDRLPADYLTLDDEPVRSLASGDPQGFVAGLGRRTVIDEVQRAPELLLAIKSRVDRDGTPGQFLLTGSANLRRIPTVADALPGRVDYLTLWPFTQGEINGRPENFLARLFDGEVPTIRDAPIGRGEYSKILLAGGFAEARVRGTAARQRFFDSYVTSIVERDVADASRILDPTSIGTLLRLLAARSGSLARYDALARDAGIDGKTAKGHVAVLERLFLVRIRQPWHVNLGQRQVKAPKLYVADTGLLAAMIGANARRVREDDGFAGALFETFVATELERQASWSSEPLSFWPRGRARGRRDRRASIRRDRGHRGQGECHRPRGRLSRAGAYAQTSGATACHRRGPLCR
jgi:uncharacterized protein